MASPEEVARAATHEAIVCLDYGMAKIDHCCKQLTIDQIWWRPHEQMNSIGNLLLHLAGNLRQWIVAGIGDAQDTRKRQSEFDERRNIPTDEVMNGLRDVIALCRETLERITADDLLIEKTIQGFDVTKMHAMLHATTHFQGHVQEIICLTRQQLEPNYEVQWAPQTKGEGA